jgi:hypothetical protein
VIFPAFHGNPKNDEFVAAISFSEIRIHHRRSNQASIGGVELQQCFSGHILLYFQNSVGQQSWFHHCWLTSGLEEQIIDIQCPHRKKEKNNTNMLMMFDLTFLAFSGSRVDGLF